jgi:prepilin-type N-terminal cleavage/methylation domain-containing protein
MKPMNSKRGITLMELMVVIAIMGILSTVAVPKLFGAGEKAREKIDLMKLYDLRNAINLALIEDLDAMTKYSTIKNLSADDKSKLNTTLANGLSYDGGATLFVIELHRDYAINVQNSHNNANNKYNVSAMIGYDGTFYEALKMANFDAVADIIADRIRDGNNYKSDKETYTSTEWKNQRGTWYRTTPRRPLFQSRALNVGKVDTNTRYTVSLHWTDPSNPYSVEVFLNPNGGTYKTAYLSDNGTCFSTLGRKGCEKKK